MDAVIVIYNLNGPEFHIRFIFLLTNKLVYGHVNVFQNMNGYLRQK